MIQRIKGEIVFVCDNCDDYLETSSDDFAEANQARQRAGWFAQHLYGEWSHSCKACGDFSYA